MDAAIAPLIMAYAALVLGLLLFVLVLRRLAIVERVREAGADTRAALTVMRTAGMDDARKEAAIQQAALRMAGASLDILARSAAALLAAMAPVYAGTLLGAYSAEQATEAAVDPFALVAFTALALALWRLRP